MKFSFVNSLKILFKPVDLTKGKPYKKIIIFMLPILISYIFQQVYAISDAAFVSVCFSDPLAWMFVFLVLMIGIYIYVIKGKSFKELECAPTNNSELKSDKSN